MSQQSYDEFEVRLALIHACDKVGSQTAFGRIHGIDPSYISAVATGRVKLGRSIPKILGFERTVRYVRKPAITSKTQPQNQTAVVP
jgi:hypothetical protein